MSQQPVQSPWGQAFVGLLAFIIYRFFVSIDASPFYLWLFGGTAAFCFFIALKGLISEFQFWRLVRGIKIPTGIYGTAIRPTAKDAKEFGLSFDNQDGMGLLVGAIDGQLAHVRGGGHITFVSPTGTGKSDSGSKTFALSAGADCNLVVTSKGLEVWEATAQYRSQVLGQECHLINTFEIDGVVGSCINPLDDIVILAGKHDSEALELGIKKSLLLMPKPKGGGGDNKFFGDFGRSFLSKAMVYVAFVESDTG